MKRGPARPVTLAVVFVVFVVFPSSAGAQGCRFDTKTNRFGTWTAIPLPETPRAAVDPETQALPNLSVRHEVDSYAVDPNDPSKLFVADEWTVMHSTDGGCHWSKSLTVLDHGGLDPRTDHIVSLTAGLGRSNATRVYALLRHGGQLFSWDDYSVSVPRLAVLTESGEWIVRDAVLKSTGGPLLGDAAKLWVGSKPGHLYMRVNDYFGPWLYASEDDGRTWELRGTHDAFSGWGVDACSAAGACDYKTLALDPLDPAILWSANHTSVLSSVDGGRSWKSLFRSSEGLIPRAVIVFRRPGSAATVIVFGVYQVVWSTDGGETWNARDIEAGFPSRQPVAGPSPREIVYVSASRARMTDVTHSRDVSLPSHGEGRRGSIRLSNVSYAALSGAYYFLGGSIEANGLRWGKALVTFTPKRQAAH